MTGYGATTFITGAPATVLVMRINEHAVMMVRTPGLLDFHRPDS